MTAIKPVIKRYLSMTMQMADTLIDGMSLNIGEYRNLYGIFTGDPHNVGSLTSYLCKSKPNPEKLRVFTACWKGHVRTFELTPSGNLYLKVFAYPTLVDVEPSIQPDNVDEKIEGDFWLQFRSDFFGNQLFVPFRGGSVVSDSNEFLLKN